MLYRLKEKCGNHRIGKETYEPGSQIESDSDLVKLFPGKFELVTIPMPQATNIAPPAIPVPGPVGGVEESKLPPVPPPHNEDNKGESEEVKDESPEPETKDYGKDVTEKFKLAEEVGLKVFLKDKLYTVIDPDDDSVLNKKELKKKAEVEAFLGTQVEDE